MMDAAKIDALGEKFGAAIAAADIAALDDLFAPEFEVWYNFSDQTLDRAQALAFFGDYFARVKVRFSGIRRLPTPTGWVQLHRVDASGAGGFAITNMPACINFTLHGDRIARIEEFLDSAQTSGFDATQMTLGPAPGD